MGLGSGEKLHWPQCGMGTAQCKKPPDDLELFLLELGEIPVDPRDGRILAVGVVITKLRARKLITRNQHGRSRGNKERGKKIAL